MNVTWYDALGLFGVGLILAAYFALQAGRAQAHGLDYQLANLVGASLVLVSLIHEFNLSAFVIETAWVLISLYGIVKARRERRTPRS